MKEKLDFFGNLPITSRIHRSHYTFGDTNKYFLLFLTEPKKNKQIESFLTQKYTASFDFLVLIFSPWMVSFFFVFNSVYPGVFVWICSINFCCCCYCCLEPLLLNSLELHFLNNVLFRHFCVCSSSLYKLYKTNELFHSKIFKMFKQTYKSHTRRERKKTDTRKNEFVL